MKETLCLGCSATYGMDIAPSVRKLLDKVFYDMEIITLEQLVKHDEKTILSNPKLTSYMRDKLLAFLDEHGLHLGMTDAEVSDYMDSEYLEEHPDEKEQLALHKSLITEEELLEETQGVQPVTTFVAEPATEIPEPEEKFEPEPEPSPIPIPNLWPPRPLTVGKSTKPVVEEIQDKERKKKVLEAHEQYQHELYLQLEEHYDPRGVLRSGDWETTLQCTAMHGFTRQPLYMKLFYSREKRVRVAVADAELLLKELYKSAKERSKVEAPIRERLNSKYEKEAELLRDLRNNK